MKIKWNRKCTKVCGNTEGGGNFHTSGVCLNMIESCFNRTCHHRRLLPRCLTRQSIWPPSWPGPAGHGTRCSPHSGWCCRHPRRRMEVSEASAQEDNKTYCNYNSNYDRTSDHVHWCCLNPEGRGWFRLKPTTALIKQRRTHSADRFCHLLHWTVLILRARALPLPPSAFSCKFTKPESEQKLTKQLHF